MPSRQSLSLLCHSAAVTRAADALAVDLAWRDDGSLSLAYRLAGSPEQLRIPVPQAPGFADGLWEHTCFEAFIAQAGDAAYREYNFSPSGQWAAYSFFHYRQRDESFRPARGPEISLHRLAGGLQLDAILPLELLPATGPGTVLQLGLSAVLEAGDGSHSYWALSHPGPRPDFHLRDAFTVNLALPPISF